jgi:hypothetical protein
MIYFEGIQVNPLADLTVDEIGVSFINDNPNFTLLL